MQVEIPSDMTPFVERLISERRFLSPSDVLAEGLRLLQSREILRTDVRRGFEQLAAGLGADAESVYQMANERIGNPV